MKTDTFFDSYIAAALWSSMDERGERGEEPLDANYTRADIVPETLACMEKDCQTFVMQWGGTLELAAQLKTGYTLAYAGADFWLTRNGHGAGFWDRDLGEIGETLTRAAHAFGEFNLYVGENGEIDGG